MSPRRPAPGPVVLLASLLLAAISGPGAATVLDGYQKADAWCWAASAEMVLTHLGAPPSEVDQRIQAGRLYPPVELCDSTLCCESCGESSVTRGCHYTGFPQLEKYGFVAEVTRPFNPLSWEALKCELDAGRPVIFAWEWLDDGEVTGSGHMMVAESAYQAQGEHWIVVRDPAPTCRGSSMTISYQEYRGGEAHAHWIDYYGIRRKSEPWEPCDPASASDAEASGPGADPALEARSPGTLLNRLADLLSTDSWFQRHLGLEGRGLEDRDLEAWCDRSSGVSVDTMPIRMLRSRRQGTSLTELTRKTDRTRYSCEVGADQITALLARRPSGTWYVAQIGDAPLAHRLQELLPQRLPGQEIHEVFVQGLNLRLLSFSGSEAAGRLVPLFDMANPEIASERSTEASILEQLQKLAREFRAVGPS